MPVKNIRLLISGGPGSGCTATAEGVSEKLGIPLFDSDSFFHKPSEPPFQEQYSPVERRLMLETALSPQTNWVVSGSVATWELDSIEPTHGVLLNISREVRLQRLAERQRTQFGNRVEQGGDMHDEHQAFMDWAAGYESREERGRNLSTDRKFLVTQCDHFMSIDQVAGIDAIVERTCSFVTDKDRRRQKSEAGADNNSGKR